MKIIIANDHKGLKLKKQVMKFLEKQNYEVVNLGTDFDSSADYPQYAFKVGKMISEEPNAIGILICGTGIGMSIAANKVRGVRCALVHNSIDAKLTREHNDANVLAIASTMNMVKLKKVILTFLKTSFSNEDRHVKRINMIKEYEGNNA